MLASQSDFISSGVINLGLFILIGILAGLGFVYGLGALLRFLGDISEGK